jgi:hypothetical protein
MQTATAVQDFPMARQADGPWLATVTLSNRELIQGYVMFDVEDQDHHVDRNGGLYWTRCSAFMGY